jgi:hypothetical protein
VAKQRADENCWRNHSDPLGFIIIPYEFDIVADIDGFKIKNNIEII